MHAYLAGNPNIGTDTLRDELGRKFRDQEAQLPQDQ